MSNYLNSHQAAEYLNISYPTFNRLRKLPNSPKGFKPLNRKLMYRPEDLDAWVLQKIDEMEVKTEMEKVEQ
ncbi:helix-turn-helix domain-containing protein [Gardnerella sp. KA00243]|uniref:DNA-binding protein n=1 Tax=Gardnerella leopoldii TaxID=2792978 RepID=A0ABX4SDN5_9BIFI|nr:DNA-binding protein [Gardnerella vaginalis]PKZ19247.1 DNA-binding protein [Gardnerella vaginalis]